MARIIDTETKNLIGEKVKKLRKEKHMSQQQLSDRLETMAIYIFHGFVYSCLKYGSSILTSVESNLECLYLLAFCFFLVWFLSRKPFVLFTNKIAHLF